MEKILVKLFKNSKKMKTLEYPPYKDYRDIKNEIISKGYQNEYALAEINFPNTSSVFLSFDTVEREEI